MDLFEFIVSQVGTINMLLAYGDKETVRGTQKDMLEVEVKECNGVKHRE